MASRQLQLSDQMKDLILKKVIFGRGRELGRGAYGRVFTVEHAGLLCAAKEVHALLLDGVSPEEKRVVSDGFMRECLQASRIRHPNIVQFMGVYYPSEQDDLPIMVMELLDTNVTDFVKNKSKIADKTKTSILHDVSLGLSHLHCRDPPIVHRDLSSNNVLLNSHRVAKISDLGMAKMIRADSKQTKSRLTTTPGTLHFMPPEALVEVDPIYGTPVDVFSFAAVGLHLFSEEWPTPSSERRRDPKTKKLVALTEAERRQPYLDKMTSGEAAAFKPTILQCLDDDPDERPPIEQVSQTLKDLKINQEMADEWINLIINFGSRDQMIQMKMSATLEQLYKMVIEKQNNSRIRFEDMRMAFGGENLERTKETLEQCGIYDRARIIVYVRMSGGSQYIQGRKIGKTVTVTNEIDVITEDDDTPTMQLPCGHAMTPESLAYWIKDQVDSRKTEIRCYKCHQKWGLSQLKDMGLTTDEKKTMELGLTENLLHHKYKCKECPRCGLYIEKIGSGYRIMCPMCDNYEFCWNCLREWKAPGSGCKDCGNHNCNIDALQQILQSCGTATISNISGVPVIRLCPACGEGIQYNEGFKHMVCSGCSHEFCFVCLKKWPCAGNFSDYSKKCVVAPRQTVKPSD